MSAQHPLTVVICLDHASVTGGQAKVAFDSAIGLKAAGHRPIVFAALMSPPFGSIFRTSGSSEEAAASTCEPQAEITWA